MNDLRDLYQEVVIDHGRRPRNFRPMEAASHHAEGYNPLCGDRLTLFLQVEDGRIRDASFQGSGCAISMASASLMTEQLRGKTPAEAEAIFQQFHTLLTTDGGEATSLLGKLTVLGGVKEYPTRVKCATLPWHTLHAALHPSGGPASTE
jgi:nitrogen fixation NifU-like protein